MKQRYKKLNYGWTKEVSKTKSRKLAIKKSLKILFKCSYKTTLSRIAKEDREEIGCFLTVEAISVHDIGLPIYNIFITKDYEKFILSAFSNFDESELEQSLLGTIHQRALSVKGNYAAVVKFSFEEGCENETCLIAGIRDDKGNWISSEENGSLFKRNGKIKDSRRRWLKFQKCLALFSSELGGNLVDVGFDCIESITDHKGKRVTLKGPTEVEEDIKNSVSPHYRRGHYRMLTHEKYKKRRIVFVKGCFVKGRAKQFEGDNVVLAQ